MITPNTLEVLVRDCMDCPFQRGRYHARGNVNKNPVCCHPTMGGKGNGRIIYPAETFKPADAGGLSPWRGPPSWCPLKNGPVAVALRES